MTRSHFRHGLALLGVALLLLTAAQAQQRGRGRKYKPPPATCKVTVTVLRADNGKPVEDASVIFHPIEGGKDAGNMELKTNQDGRTSLDLIPVGDNVRVQVIASGFQTFGGEYELPGDSRDITIKLRKPGRQYSIYETHPDQSASQPQEEKQQQNEQKPPQ
ncbi:MAG TPA: hypothetical protein VFJ10_07980 [Acidobacteriaceae bacterium]|jgi:hypothetical protein|nr:hypothetical protein [Acidobacteriaceae bacterium]